MPNEILTEICIRARDGDDTKSRGKEWLRAARLTCKQLHVPATVEFGKRFLATIPVMAARQSLETLFDICKHPLIGPRVSEIQFYGRRYCSNSFSDLSDEVERVLDERNLRGARKFTRQLRLVLDFLDEEFDIEQYQGAFKYLEGALKMVQGYGNAVTLSVFTDANVKPVGMSQAIEQLSNAGQGVFTSSEDSRCNLIDLDCVASTLRVLLVAAAKSDCHVERLKLSAGISINHEERNISQWATEDRSLADAITKLHSGVRILHIDVLRGKLVRDLNQVLNGVLQRVQNLVELRIRAADDDDFEHCEGDMPVFDAIFQFVESRCLCIVDLQEVLCTQEAILFLLKRNRGTIRELRLSNVVLQGSWEEVMAWVKDHCSLTFLSAADLTEVDENFGVPRCWADKDGFAGRGKAGVLSSLERFLQQKRREEAGEW